MVEVVDEHLSTFLEYYVLNAINSRGFIHFKFSDCFPDVVPCEEAFGFEGLRVC